MPEVLHPDARADKLKQAGQTVISHILYDEAEKANRTGSNPLKTDIRDGFYRIIQHRCDNTVADACLDLDFEDALPVKMKVINSDSPIPRIWRLTRQYGCGNSFTIVPVVDPSDYVKHELGPTTLIKDGEIYVEGSKCYPIWTIESKAATSYFEEDGTLKTIHRFRIEEIGSDRRCWWTDEDGKIVSGQAVGGRPPPNQLYELVEAVGIEIDAFEALEEISVTASSAALVKKFYFGSGDRCGREFSNLLSFQLETDARDQGWASEPPWGLWSWFELAIFTKLPGEGQTVTPDMMKAGPKGEPLTWLSLSKDYSVDRGLLFHKDHEIWRFIGQDDYIGVLH
ncbi:hypothetical protein FRC07_013986 [Ceratobasidium sp. 392]|nr:hypothetical protein FRC07_013986 [Ceratobasidium sp. 392]